jgi:NAD(P)-dependent dehydrogenase (short-subunit alcohol dehydrogenase family)
LIERGLGHAVAKEELTMLEGKVIVVTGAASGIGEAAAHLFAEYGASVVVADRNGEGAESCAYAIGGDAHAIKVDVADENQVSAMIDTTIARFGRFDGAFNNAGVETLARPLHEIELLDWRKVMSVDLDGVFLCIKHQVRAMLAGGRGGSIVNTASTLSQVAMVNGSEYVAAKHGVLGLTRAAALDYAQAGIRVNAVLPGVIKTAIMDRFMQDPAIAALVDGMRAAHPVGRFGTPLEIAEAAAWLLSDKASFVTGTGLSADGGFQAQ